MRKETTGIQCYAPNLNQDWGFKLAALNLGILGGKMHRSLTIIICLLLLLNSS